MAAKRKNVGARERLARKQEEAMVTANSSVESVETPVAEVQAETAAEKPAKAKQVRKKLTLEDIRKKAIAAAERAARLAAQVQKAENPELAEQIEASEKADKEAASLNRFIALREKGIRTLERKLSESRLALADLYARRESLRETAVEARTELTEAGE